MEKRKVLVLSTAVLALSTLSGTAVYELSEERNSSLSVATNSMELSSSHENQGSSKSLPFMLLETKGHPSIGSGKIEMVLIEDLRCRSCRVFSEEVFPEIASRYVEKGKAKFTVVPVAFLEGSKPLANAALSVHRQAPDKFFPFIHELFKIKMAKKAEILEAARKVGGIDLDVLSKAIDDRLYYDDLESNFQWAKNLMGNRFATPTLLINGIQTSTASFSAVEIRIEEIDKGK